MDQPDVQGILELERRIRSHFELLPFGRLSPSHPLTLSDDDRRAAGIPETAQLFSFAYPLPDMDFDPEAMNIDLSRPVNLLALFGGFIYLEVAPDGSVQLCACNALTERGAALEFDGPFCLDRIDLGDRLFGDNRVQDVTMDALTDLGVQKFCFLGPREAVWSSDGRICLADGSGWPHGAFVYLYDDRFLDCYFRVKQGRSARAADDAHEGADAASDAAAVQVLAALLAAERVASAAVLVELHEAEGRLQRSEADVSEAQRVSRYFAQLARLRNKSGRAADASSGSGAAAAAGPSMAAAPPPAMAADESAALLGEAHPLQ